ncbi:MAG: hypothetical protein ABW157_13515 [Candidatus Thiodiazotropha sp. LLP2]
MSTDLSKLCADYLRTAYTATSSQKLKATHARELVAAFFGYKSHAALIAETAYPLDNLEEAYIFVPDIPLMERRRNRLSGLPEDLPPSEALAKQLAAFLSDNGHCGGNVWLYESLETYIMEVLLIEHDDVVSDALSGTMAETNAAFTEYPYYEKARIEDTRDELVTIVTGQLQGEPLDDKLFCGDTINMSVRVTLPRMAGKRGFYDFELEAGGAVNDDWRDKEMHYEVPNIRPKDQWLEMTGGFRLGETQEQFQNRQTEIHTLRNRIAQGKAGVRDVERLSHLLGTDQEDEFDSPF